MMPRRQNRAGDGGEFASAHRRRDAKRIAEHRAVKVERRPDRRPLAREPGIVDAGARPAQRAAPPPSSAAHSIAAVVVLAMPISPTTSSSLSLGTVR